VAAGCIHKVKEVTLTGVTASALFHLTGVYYSNFNNKTIFPTNIERRG